MRNLQEEIGNLTNVKELAMGSIPDSLRRLKYLTRLHICNDCAKFDYLGKDEREYLLMLIQHCRLLSSLSFDLEEDVTAAAYKYNTTYAKELWYELVCNIARSRTGFGIMDEKTNRITPKLWPHVLDNAARAFYAYQLHWSSPDALDNIYLMTKTDDIYQLLIDRRESFVGVLVRYLGYIILVGNSKTFSLIKTDTQKILNGIEYYTPCIRSLQ